MASRCSVSSSAQLQAHLESVLPQEARSALRTSVLPAILDALADIADTLRASQHVTLAGSANTFGDDQLNVDVSAENHIRQALARCPSVKTASSEEDPVETSVVHAAIAEIGTVVTQERYTVAFDPLDGSSIIAPNWTVGTILGIWDGDSAIGQSPRERQIASLLGVFGPRTTAIIALKIPGTSPTCFEVGLGRSADSLAWEVLRTEIALSAAAVPKTRYFAPANLRSAAESKPYMQLVSHFISEKYTLRYSGGLVPDLVHALVKGHGIYVSPVTAASKAKLRRLYELCPVALIMECAGGAAVDPSTGLGILDTPLKDTDERAGLLCGNVGEVESAAKVLLQ